MNWQSAVERTVVGMGYELVDCSRTAGGLLTVFIDRVPGRTYATGDGEVITVDDCEQVTRQLQYVLEVEGCDYARLEVSSPGLDRPLRKASDYLRYLGVEIDLTLKLPFQGRKKFRGVLQSPVQSDPPVGVAQAHGDAVPAPVENLPQLQGFELVFDDGKAQQVLGFDLGEVREARLVPVVDFKKGREKRRDARRGARRARGSADEAGAALEQPAGEVKDSGDHEE